jgi:AhpD family alkylhydroperoxidase
LTILEEKILSSKEDAIAKLSESPEMLNSFLQASKAFEGSTLDPLSQEVVVMTVATRNQCRLCIGMHTGRLRDMKADPALITALREGKPLADAKLEALRQFVLNIQKNEPQEFLAAGYTERNALEVILGIGAYTMSTYANRFVGV